MKCVTAPILKDEIAQWKSVKEFLCYWIPYKWQWWNQDQSMCLSEDTDGLLWETWNIMPENDSHFRSSIKV